MNKLLLVFGLLTGGVGLSYGMDGVDPDARRNVSILLLNDHIKNKNWSGVLRDLEYCHPNDLQELEDIFLKQDIQQLDSIAVDEEGLFQQLLWEYFRTEGFKKDFWKSILKKLLYKGLDFKVRKNDHYVYQDLADTKDEAMENAFWGVLDEMMQEEPDKMTQLVKGFEDEVEARKVKLTKQEKKHEAQPTQKVLNKKFAVMSLYLGIGSVVALLVYIAYQQYLKYGTQGQEDTKEQQEINATISGAKNE